MWLVSLRDLQWRRRRFVVGVLGAALLFAVTLVLAGLSSNLREEATATVEAIDVDHWVVVDGTTGPISGVSAMPIDVVDELSRVSGVERAAPLVMVRQSIDIPGRDLAEDVVLFGLEPGGLGEPDVVEGRTVEAPGEAVIDEWSGLAPGDVVRLGAVELTIVGTTRGRTVTGGISSMYADIAVVHDAVFRGVPLVQAVLLEGTPSGPTDGYVVLTPREVVDDILRPLRRLLFSVGLVSFLLWAAAAAVVGSIVYLTAVERTRDFAALRAVGATRASLLVGLAIQGIVATMAAAVLSVFLALLIIPLFPVPLSLASTSLVLLGPLAISVGLLASAVSVRRVMSVDPALAFSSA